MIQAAGGEEITDRVREEIRKRYCSRGGHAYSEFTPVIFVETKAGTILWWCTQNCSRKR